MLSRQPFSLSTRCCVCHRVCHRVCLRHCLPHPGALAAPSHALSFNSSPLSLPPIFTPFGFFVLFIRSLLVLSFPFNSCDIRLPFPPSLNITLYCFRGLTNRLRNQRRDRLLINPSSHPPTIVENQTQSAYSMHCCRGKASFLFVILATFLRASASDIDSALQQRQNAPIGTGASASAAAASSASASSASAARTTTASSTSVVTSATPSSTPAPSTSDQPASSSIETTTATRTTANVSPTFAQTSSQAASSTSSVDDVTSQSDSTPITQSSSGARSSSTEGSSGGGSQTSSIRTVAVTSRTQQIVATVVTISGGSTISNVLTTTAVVAVTSTPGLSGSNGNSGSLGSTGLDQSQKRTIIGVVVGVGGAALIGGLALVAWRIWGRNRRSNDEDDLMDSQPGSSGHEKTSSLSGNSPFPSTLDQYHNPAGPVNASSNF